jgi:hypothetical protein
MTIVYQPYGHRDFWSAPHRDAERRALETWAYNTWERRGWLLFNDERLVGSTRSAGDAVHFVATGRLP